MVGPASNASSNGKKKNREANTDPRQLEIYVDFLECNKDFASGVWTGSYSEQDYGDDWDVLKDKLNSVPQGPNFGAEFWKTRLSAWKNDIRGKARRYNAEMEKSGLGEIDPKIKPPTELEYRALQVFGLVGIRGNKHLRREAGFDKPAYIHPSLMGESSSSSSKSSVRRHSESSTSSARRQLDMPSTSFAIPSEEIPNQLEEIPDQLEATPAPKRRRFLSESSKGKTPAGTKGKQVPSNNFPIFMEQIRELEKDREGENIRTVEALEKIGENTGELVRVAREIATALGQLVTIMSPETLQQSE